MRKIFYYSLLCAVWFGANSCKDDLATSPPKPSFTVDKTTGLSGDADGTVFTFTVPAVGGQSVSVLPYGVENLAWGGILISKFTDGKAVVTFTYEHVGTFNAVVVSNNHSANGESVKNTYSDPISIKITSDQTGLSDFAIPGQSSATVVGNNITIVMPFRYNYKQVDVTSLVPTFTSSDFSTVLVGSAAQTSGTTANNFTSPVTYTVKADNGTTQDYTVTVNTTSADLTTTVKSFSGVSTGKGGDKGAAYEGYVDNANQRVFIISADNGAVAAAFDSVDVKYELTSGLSTLAYPTTGNPVVKQDDVIDFSDNGVPKTLVVHAEDSVNTTATYTFYHEAAPAVTVTFSDLNPALAFSNDGFALSQDVIFGTSINNLVSDLTVTPATGTAILGYTIDGSAFNSGDPIDLSTDKTLGVIVKDTNTNFVFTVNYALHVSIVH